MKQNIRTEVFYTPYFYPDWRNDYLCLMRAYDLGGACVVADAEMRASLARAGLMARSNAMTHGRRHPHTMALTKAGRKRAEQLYEQRVALRNTRGNAPIKIFKRNTNRVINKNDKITAHTSRWVLRAAYGR